MPLWADLTVPIFKVGIVFEPDIGAESAQVASANHLRAITATIADIVSSFVMSALETSYDDSFGFPSSAVDELPSRQDRHVDDGHVTNSSRLRSNVIEELFCMIRCK